MSTAPLLTAQRQDTDGRALITVSGELDLDSAPRLREFLDGCLRDGILLIDVDLTAVSFCDVSGLRTFLRAARRTAARGGSLRLHHPRPILARLFLLTRTNSLLLAPAGSPPCAAGDPVAPRRDPAGRHEPALLAEAGGAR